MKVTIVVKGQKYNVFGVDAVEPLESHKDGLFFYFSQKMDGRWTRTVRYAKVKEVRLCDLGNEFTTFETKQALGWL